MILDKLKTSADTGLSEVDFEHRLNHFGTNKKEPPERTPYWEFFKKAIDDFMLKLLLVCACVDIGFGLGFSVMLDPAKAQILGTPGEYAWGGAASTAFWCDPAEDMAVVMLTQLMPSSTYPIRRELRVLTYQAVID